jgi:hypothetical protein
MTPAPPAARRLPLRGCALTIAATMALSACGSGGAATTENATATQAKQQKGAATAGGEPCPASVTAFVASLDRLRHQLAIGLSYEQYVAKVKGLNRSYETLPVDRLSIDCVATTGSPAEDALNKYIDAANAWGDCLADASCATETIEPTLQRKWQAASSLLSKAQ